MFEILHPPSINNWTTPRANVDLNFRRRRTDIYSVESLNYCKTVRITSTQTNMARNSPLRGGNGNHNDKKDKKDPPPNTINVNVKVLREECDCAVKKKKKAKQGDETKDLECYCAEGLPKEQQTIKEEVVGKKTVNVVGATAATARGVGAKTYTPRKEATFEKMITYQVHGRAISDPAGFDWTKTYWYGEKGSGFKTKTGGPQDFYALREQHLKSRTLYEDPEFPANNYSLFASGYADRHFIWKRPGEICDDPQLFVEGFSRFDVQQGELGDCWLLAAVANLTMYRRLFFQIVPDDQGFGDDYAGIFHFRFWQYGRWVDIVVDDRLPTDGGKLVYLHSTEENEFWSALLEKAYAKLHGSYEALKGGSTCEAMEDFTGGVTEMYELENSPPNLFKILEKAFQRASLMGCSLEPDPNVLEAQTPEGLIRGHAYSITKVVYLNISTPNVSGKIPLLRLRNPWGNEIEWNGPWSDGAPEWRYIVEEDKKKLGLIFDNDGEFWMSYKDWEKHFDRLEICNLNPDSLSDNESQNKRKWEMSIFEGAWVKGVTAGGCRNFLETFWNNPQYRITLTEVDEDDDDNKCTCIVALMQKNRRQIKTQSGEELLTLGFAIYFLPNPDRVPKPLDMNFFKYNASVARSPSFINLREVSCRFKLPPGTYCIVPSTYDKNEEGEFLLRVFSEHQNNMQEHDETIGYGDVDERILSKKGSADELKEFKRKQSSMLDFDFIAGEDSEIDYLELKTLLDKTFKAEGEEGAQTSGGSDVLCNLYDLCCGLINKNSEAVEKAKTVLLSELKGGTFSKEVCRCMVAMLDYNFSGKLDKDEFAVLWELLITWRKAFLLFDIDNSGSLSGFELRNALSAAGYKLTNHVLNIMMHRYGNEKTELSIDAFLLCAVRLKTMIDKFEHRQRENVLVMSKEEWIETTLYC
ncbi:calpain-A-like isoform X2 [Harmonia axyridis]|uniref:calpain-A-like isoform X2 n=1 Tax=Harmonia axyridis TaxID=115357 RepID=UPI001E275E9C|nr:calpain-A-like isoform X2 [Harmonia axyridis]